MSAKSREGKRGKERLSLHPIPFKEAVADALKVPPPPDKKRRGRKRKKLRGDSS